MEGVPIREKTYEELCADEIERKDAKNRLAQQVAAERVKVH